MSEPDTSYVAQLDPRQRAMLAEMGVRVWAPAATEAPAPAPVPAAQPEPAIAPAAPATPVAAPPARPPARPPEPAAPPPATPAPIQAPHAPAVASMDWPELQASVAACEACGLCRSRTQTVFGVGSTQANVMIVGEAPGEQEDRQGEPFVGPAGQLLDAMLRAIQHDRQATDERGVYIANVLKCRPPANRNPAPDEVLRCEPYLARQVALVKPRVIIAMGRFAVQSLLNTTDPIGRLRGRVHHYQGVPVVVTYHPAYLLRTPADKAKAWADLCLAMDTLTGATPN